MKYKNRTAHMRADGSLVKKPSAPGRKEKDKKTDDSALYERLLTEVSHAGSRGISFSHLVKALRLRSNKALERVILKAERAGKIVRKDGYFYRLPDKKNPAGPVIEATLLRLKRTFAFARQDDPEKPDIFIPGSKLAGALPGDRVALLIHKGTGGRLDDGEVIKIVRPGDGVFVGVIRMNGRYAEVQIDELGDDPFPLSGGKNCREGDRVRVEMKRADRHADMSAKLLQNYGSSEIAANCAASILDAAGISPDFPSDVEDEARSLQHKGIHPEDLFTRLDLRDQLIFTIDSAESKDLDDAISLEKLGEDWLLGVHIADVAHYVRHNTPLDREAMRRGTSIYYADKVVPMLPKALSNGICSLNPGEDRLAFSALLTIDKDGKLIDFDFRKSVIRSRVKGVYAEINRLLDGDTDPALMDKYADVLSILPEMAKLASIRQWLRAERGAPDIDSAECKLTLDEAGFCVDVKPRTTGFSEGMIEEFMLLANEAAATLGKMLEIPFIYRVHEKPDAKKIDTLRAILKAVGEDTAMLRDKVPASTLRQILLEAADKPYKTLLNRQVLRSMMKAKYDIYPIGHYGLVLDNYAHFTSPIRRYPDLAIHRILSSLTHELYAEDAEFKLPAAAAARLQRKYRDFVGKAALLSSEAELQAQQIERDCEDCYKAEFMHGHLGECYDGVISAVTGYGFYVELPSGVEGMVRLESLPEGNYFFDEMMELTETFSGVTYRTGDRVRVQCVRADVSSGQIDFILEKLYAVSV